MNPSYRHQSYESADRLKHLPSQFFAGLVKKVNEEIANGHDVINLGQGNPDLPTSPHIVKKLQEAAENPKFHKYSPFRGYAFLKEAIAARYQEDYGVKLNPDTEVAILFGGKTGLIEISQCVLNPGDICLVPDPGYPDYWSGVAMAGGRMVFMPLLESNGYLPDYERISEQDANLAKLMFINYPNNPTGACATEQFYKQTIAFAERHGVIVASDFAYGAIGFDRKRPLSFLQFEGAKDVGVEFYTMSKTYNMAGWRVGFALGNSKIIEMINLIQDHYFVSLFGAIQAAAAHALSSPQDNVRKLVETYEHRRNTLIEACRSIGWEASYPEGSFFAWLPVPSGFNSVDFADRLLREAKVMVAAGAGFGTHGEGYVRVGLLDDEKRIKEAIERIGQLHLWD